MDDAHEAIVSRKLWERRSRMEGVVQGRGARGAVHILSGDGLMRCSRCRYHFHGMKGETSGKRYYVDGGYHNGGREVCDLTLVSAEALERRIVEAIRSVAFKLFDDEADLEREVDASWP